VKTAGRINCIDKLTGINQIVVGTSRGHLEIFNYESNCDRESQIHGAHRDQVTGISASPTKEKCWVTSSSDLNCVLWDNKKASPALFLLKHHRNRLTDVKWLSENLILASDSSGSVNLIDPRHPKVVIRSQKVADRSINSLIFDKSMKRFGVISDSPVLKIYQIATDGEFKLVHEHSARPHLLYSMAWDTKEENSCYVVGDKKYAKKISWSI
jgi:WD40 repeat protein